MVTFRRLTEVLCLGTMLMSGLGLCGQKDYVYSFNKHVVHAKPTFTKFLVKLGDASSYDNSLRILESSGLVRTGTIMSGDQSAMYVMEAPTRDPSLLLSIKSVPGIQFAMPIFQDESGLEHTVGNQLVVVMKPGVRPEFLEAFGSSFGMTVKMRDEWATDGMRFVLCIPWDSEKDVFEVSRELEALPEVRFATPDFIVFNSSCGGEEEPDDEYYPNQWYLDKINAVGAWEHTTGSSSVTIAVIDNGVDLDHDDLDGQLVQGRDVVNSDDVPTPDGTTTAYAHGTACTGIIGAVANNQIGIAGLASGCVIMPIRVNTGDYGLTSNLVTGINWAVGHGADILSMSVNGAGSDDLVTALNNAANNGRNYKGCVLVGSSGNNDVNPGQMTYPAIHPNVLAVGASNASDQRWSFSCYGENLDVMAPSSDGSDFYTLDLSGQAGAQSGDYWPYFGKTSAACPQVAALAGLILSEYPDLTREQVYGLIAETADDIAPTGWDMYTGWGRINAERVFRRTTSGTVSDKEVWFGTMNVPAGLTIASGGHVHIWANSTINLGGNITISPGGQLTIDAGSSFNVQGNYKLRVEGRLVATGTSFTRSSGQWYGIEFYAGTTGSTL